MTFEKTSYANLAAMTSRLNINGYEDATLFLSNCNCEDRQNYAILCAIRCVWIGNACCIILTADGAGSAEVLNGNLHHSLSEIEEWLTTQLKSYHGYGDNVFIKLAQCPLCGYDAVLEPMAVRKGYEADVHCNACLASLHTITYETEIEAVSEALTGWNIRKTNQVK